jgi:hypothetical protein
VEYCHLYQNFFRKQKLHNQLQHPAPAPVAPTQAEVSQSSATDADGSSTSVKTKRKGRSATILTSSAGVEGDATLGKKSLLGG